VAVAVDAAGRQEAHLAVEHSETCGRRIDAAPQNLRTLAVPGGIAPGFRYTLPVRLHPKIPESGRRRPG
jgi:hypothetical protein